MYAESAIRLSTDERIHADVQRTLGSLVAPFVLAMSFQHFRLVYYFTEGYLFEWKRAYKLVGSLVKSILTRHPILPQWRTHSESHVNSNPRVFSDAQRGESAATAFCTSFVAVILSTKQALNILNIFHRTHINTVRKNISFSLSCTTRREKIYATEKWR